jgi:hypothetical protein
MIFTFGILMIELKNKKLNRYSYYRKYKIFNVKM